MEFLQGRAKNLMSKNELVASSNSALLKPVHIATWFLAQRERETPQDRLISQERRGEEWIATKQIVVQCPVCQEYYHLKELKNVDQARNRKLSGVCR